MERSIHASFGEARRSAFGAKAARSIRGFTGIVADDWNVHRRGFESEARRDVARGGELGGRGLLRKHDPGVHEVDLKLIELARTLQGKIVTNDFNLNKVAQLRGVDVLNVNDLANSLKPVVLPGEIMKVFILKEGKEYSQGVAYLDDGTMVVVDNARKMISKTIDIVVTSVLQTTAGKMIFGRYIESGAAAQQAVSAPVVPAREKDEHAKVGVRPAPVQPQQT